MENNNIKSEFRTFLHSTKKSHFFLLLSKNKAVLSLFFNTLSFKESQFRSGPSIYTTIAIQNFFIPL